MELTVLIAILGTLAALLIPTFTGAIESARVAGGTSNARNLSTLLMTEAAYDNTAYLPTDRVWEIAEENNISLESEVGHYSYWYDASANRVTYAETASMLSGAANLNAARAAGDYPFEPETLVEGQTNYRYIERSDNPIRRALDVIRGVSGNASAAEVDSALQSAIDGLSEQSLKDHFANFKTDKCVYFTDSGVVKGSGTTFDYAVVPFNTAVLPTLTAEQNITIFHEIALPASVNIVSTNAFFGVTADVSASSAVVVEGNTGLTGDFSHSAPAGNVINIDGTNGNKVEDYLTIDFAAGTWVYYQTGQPMEVSEAQKKTYDPAVGCDYAYVMPAVTLKGGEKGSFFDRVEKLTVRSKLVSGGIEFVMVAVDSSYNVYKLSGVGIVTEVGVSYPDYTKRLVTNEAGEEMEESITVKNYNAINTRRVQLIVSDSVSQFSNLADCKVTLSYVTGKAVYATMDSPFGFPLYNSVYRKTAATWGTEQTEKEISFSELSQGFEVTFDETGSVAWNEKTQKTDSDLGENEFYLTEMKVNQIEVKLGDTLIYVRNY